jgi:hypothetical protein
MECDVEPQTQHLRLASPVGFTVVVHMIMQLPAALLPPLSCMNAVELGVKDITTSQAVPLAAPSSCCRAGCVV